MNEIYSFKRTNSLSRDKLNYQSGKVRSIHYGDIHTKFSTHFRVEKERVPFVNEADALRPNPDDYCVEGDMVFADASEDLQDVGKSIEVMSLNHECVVSGQHTILARQTKDLLVLGFGGYLFQAGTVRAQIRKEAQGAKVLGISSRKLASVTLSYPSDKEEQTKIVECLTSIDERIAAEGRKLRALSNHRESLLQQLFPANGETVPLSRFPEFQNAREWQVTRLGALVTLQSGGTPSKASPELWDGSIPWVSAKDMKRLFLNDTQDHISVKAIERGAKLVPAGTLLILTRGMTLLKDVPICVLRREMSFNQDVKALRPKVELNGVFLALALLKNKQRLLRMVDVAGHGTGKLNTDELEAFEFAYPEPAEQQQIAACLSSLDQVLAAQTRKVEVLAAHKKGLMQQLFPALDEVQT